MAVSRPRLPITVELLLVMTGLLLISLVVVVIASDNFLRKVGRDLVGDQDRVAKEIVARSVEALQQEGEKNLTSVVKDKSIELDESFAAIERLLNVEAATAERLFEHPEEAPDLTLIDSTAFADPARRPKDFLPEKGKNRRSALGEILTHRSPGADATSVAADMTKLRGIGFTMMTLYRENPIAAWIYLATADGLYLGYPADDSLEASYDPRTRDWYRDARRRGGVVWSRPYRDPSGALLLTCSRPFRRSRAYQLGVEHGSPSYTARETAGVAAVDVTIEELETLLAELHSDLHGWAFLADETGKIIASPEHARAVDEPSPFGSDDDLAASEDVEVSALARRLTEEPGGLAELGSRPEPLYVAFSRIPTTGWTLGLAVPVEQIVAPARTHEAELQEVFRAGNARIGVRVDQARRKFGAWGIVGVMVLVLGTTGFVWVRFTRPIKGFIRDIAVISRGNLDHRLVANSENELGELAAAFNDMTSELKRSRDQIEEYSRNLERKVEARTAELASSNSELADAIRRLQDAQGKLVHSEKMASLGQLVAGIAHEINNPVNFIANSVYPLQEALNDFAKIIEMREKGATIEEIDAFAQEVGLNDAIGSMRKAVELIQTGANRTKSIVLQLRNFSRLDEADMKAADIHEGIDGSIALLNYKIKDRIDVDRNYGQIGIILCYPGQLNQVFMNVLANAVHAIEAVATANAKGLALPGGGEPRRDYRGKISITTRREERKVIVRIADNGTGIPAHVIPKIFDPFFTTKDREKGTGLGLSISHGIVEKHGGKIEVITEVGKGTEFVITLPIQVESGVTKVSTVRLAP